MEPFRIQTYLVYFAEAGRDLQALIHLVVELVKRAARWRGFLRSDGLIVFKIRLRTKIPWPHYGWNMKTRDVPPTAGDHDIPIP